MRVTNERIEAGRRERRTLKGWGHQEPEGTWSSSYSVDGEAQDHVLVAGESSDESAGLGGEGATVVVVVGPAFGQCAQVVVPDLGQDLLAERFGTGGAGVVGGLVGLQQSVGHGLGPELTEGVSVTEGA